MDVQAALTTGMDSRPRSRLEGKNPLTNYYATKDQRWIMVTHIQPDPYWAKFCRAIGREELERDPRFESFNARVEHSRELIDIVDAEFGARTLDEWKERLTAHGIIWSAVQTLTEVVRDPQAWANGYFMPLDHPQHGKMHLVASPVKLGKTPAAIRSKAPDLGEHTDEVLRSLGYNDEALRELRRDGVI
jgi:crotonobetainyl-CoA:carnitine CoA-transferase CaiB-like acyl-CoA transferase